MNRNRRQEGEGRTMPKKMTKLEAVYQFVMGCISNATAGDIVETFEWKLDEEQGNESFMQFIPDGDAYASMPTDTEIEIVFGGDIYIVKITKARRIS